MEKLGDLEKVKNWDKEELFIDIVRKQADFVYKSVIFVYGCYHR